MYFLLCFVILVYKQINKYMIPDHIDPIFKIPLTNGHGLYVYGIMYIHMFVCICNNVHTCLYVYGIMYIHSSAEKCYIEALLTDVDNNFRLRKQLLHMFQTCERKH